MPLFVQLAPFIPFLAMIPPSLAAMWIASRWLKSKGSSSEIAELRQALVDIQERVDFNERMLSQVREAQRELPRGS
jgi:hypothetical protein